MHKIKNVQKQQTKKEKKTEMQRQTVLSIKTPQHHLQRKLHPA
jgi:hypothetical protein